MSENAKFAWISLCRLGGCNYKRPVEYRGKSVYVEDPHKETTYRLSAAKFIAGKTQIRDSWAICLWDATAERITESERNWQT
ncbi:MAG: hypothetical protein V3W44_08440 [Dehalococcoidales bacterium]